MTAATYIGVDLADGVGRAVLVEYVDGKIKICRELDLNNPADWTGLKVDGVFVEENDL